MIKRWSQPSNQFTALSRDLVKFGVFTQDEEETEPNISTPTRIS